MQDMIKIKGAKEHNLKNVSINIPKNKLIAITGVSGSGKSTFAMDILQKECQRQYMESMGLVTDGLNKPLVDSIVGLSPSIAVGQRVLSNNPRSTVGTYTEVLTYLRILYAKLGVRTCHKCNGEIQPDYDLDDVNELDGAKIMCPHCKAKADKLTMAHFSFNKPEGACSRCKGVGVITELDLSAFIDESLTIEEGAVSIWIDPVIRTHYCHVMEKCAAHYGFQFNPYKPIKEFNHIEKLVFYQGVDSEEFKERYSGIKRPKRVNDGYFRGLRTYMEEKAEESVKKEIKNSKIESCIIKTKCPECGGSKLGIEARTVTIDKMTIIQMCALTLKQLYEKIQSIFEGLDNRGRVVASVVIEDILKRTKGLINIGLSYLSIDRPVSTLSGGEAQRIRLSSIMDSALTGVLYILDEPTTGLHPRDTKLLLKSLLKLRDLGNTVLVIEHDMEFVKGCDYVIDFGPGAGIHGGEIIGTGTPLEIMKNEESLTGKYLKEDKSLGGSKSITNRSKLSVVEANANNLKNISVDITLGQIVSFTGVSGSGKSSLVFDVIAAYSKKEKTQCKEVGGFEDILRVIELNQCPIGRQSRSNIATYTDIYTPIRELFAALPEAKKLKLKPSDFSFNVKGGRCEKCQGLGVIPLDMQFLDDIEVSCPLCNGKRFKKKILEVRYNGKNISEILEDTVEENLLFFKEHREIHNRLKTLCDVGLEYLKLGQSTITLSGGECQRIKLSKELGKSSKEHTLYLLDEPTTGLHPSDIDKLLKLLKSLVAENNSIFIIEHALEIISNSDYIIDMGPEGGTNGGGIVAKGTPKEIMENEKSITGKYLKQFMEDN